jgi:MoxR-like ATPase
MQEHRVTAAGATRVLPEPFFVLATQNPIEQEGTYPLPEAQLDRFLFNIQVGYPEEADEVAILRSTTGAASAPLRPVLGGEDARALQRLVRDVAAAEPALQYAAALARASRPDSSKAPAMVKRYVRWGAGPRAGQALILGAKAHALLQGRLQVGPADLQRVALPVLRHRILLTFAAEAEGMSPEQIVNELVTAVPVPASGVRV